MTQKKFEHYNWYPTIILLLIIVFSVIAYQLSVKLYETANDLEEFTMSLEERIQYVDRMNGSPDTSTNN